MQGEAVVVGGVEGPWVKQRSQTTLKDTGHPNGSMLLQCLVHLQQILCSMKGNSHDMRIAIP